jgi:hypothetical protein
MEAEESDRSTRANVKCEMPKNGQMSEEGWTAFKDGQI